MRMAGTITSSVSPRLRRAVIPVLTPGSPAGSNDWHPKGSEVTEKPGSALKVALAMDGPATRASKPRPLSGGRAFREGTRRVKLASGDYIDMKMYEPAMRHLLDTYIRRKRANKSRHLTIERS